MTMPEIRRIRKKLSQSIKRIKSIAQSEIDTSPANAFALSGIGHLNEAIVQCGFDTSSTNHEETILEEFIDWLLTDVEYCSHMILMTSGLVLVNQHGCLVNDFLWAPSGHQTLLTSDQLVEATERRLDFVFQTLRLIFACESFARSTTTDRRRRILAASIWSERREKEVLGLAFSNFKLMPFVDAIQENPRDSYRLGYMEAMQFLLAKTTDLRWNLAVFGDGYEIQIDEIQSVIKTLPASKKLTEAPWRKLFLEMSHKAFDKLPDLKEKKRIMKYVHDEFELVEWHEDDDRMAYTVTSILTTPIESEQRFRQAVGDLCWSFTISAKFAWRHLLLVVLRRPDIIPVTIKLLRQLPMALRLRSAENGSLIIFDIARSLILDVNEEEEWNLHRFIAALVSAEASSSITSNGQYVQSVKASILGLSECIRTLILPILERKPRTAVVAFALILDGPNIQWSLDPPTVHDRIGNNAAKLCLAILEIISRSNEREVVDCGIRILTLLFANWNCYKLILPPATLEFLESNLEKLQLTLETRAFMYWNLRRVTDSAIKIPIAYHLQRMLELPIHVYGAVCCDQNADSKLEYSLIKLLELAKISMDLVVDILSGADAKKLLEMVKSSDFGERLINALVRALTENIAVQHWRNCVDILTMFCDRAMIEDICEVKSYKLGVQNVAVITKMFDAMERMLTSTTPDDISATYISNFGIILNDVITERVLPCHNPLAKFISWKSLSRSCCRFTRAYVLTGNAIGALSSMYSRIEKHEELAKAELRNIDCEVMENGVISRFRYEF